MKKGTLALTTFAIITSFGYANENNSTLIKKEENSATETKVSTLQVEEKAPEVSKPINKNKAKFRQIPAETESVATEEKAPCKEVKCDPCPQQKESMPKEKNRTVKIKILESKTGYRYPEAYNPYVPVFE